MSGRIIIVPDNAGISSSASRSSAKPLVVQVCAIDLSVKALLKGQILALERAGYEVISVCSDGPAIPQLRAEGLKIHPISITRQITPLADLVSLWRLFRFLGKARPTIVHSHTPKAAFVAQVAATLARVPIRINTIHGYYFLAARGMKRWLFQRMEVLTCKLCTHVFSQSQEDVELTLKKKWLPPQRIEHIGNGIDISRFDPAKFSADDRPAVRQELRIPPDAFVVGIVARMVREKGFAELFEAFAQFRQSAPNAYLVHVGFVDRSRGDEVTPDSAEQFGIAEYCRFLGQREDVPRLLNAIDVFCLPSYREGYPRSVLEANALGVPAVVTDIRGCREAVVPGVNGLLVPPRQVEPLTAALRTLYNDPALRRQMGWAARERAISVFDEVSVFRTIIQRYNRLTGRD